MASFIEEKGFAQNICVNNPYAHFHHVSWYIIKMFYTFREPIFSHLQLYFHR